MRLSAHQLLRAAVGFAFLYAGVASLLQPDNWIGYLPAWINSIIPAAIFLNLYSIFEVLLAIWLFSGIKTKFSALIAAAMLAGIVIFNFSDLMIVFRDVTILGCALALAKLSIEEKR